MTYVVLKMVGISRVPITFKDGQGALVSATDLAVFLTRTDPDGARFVVEEQKMRTRAVRAAHDERDDASARALLDDVTGSIRGQRAATFGETGE